MNNSKLAIVIELNGEIKEAAKQCWEDLSKYLNVKDISSKSPCPHINLEYNFTSNNKKIYEIFNSCLNNLNSFSVQSRGLGVFLAGTPVVHIRWLLNENLIKLKENLCTKLKLASKENIINGYNEDINWQPKTTLAFKDTSYENLGEVIKITKKFDFEKKNTLVNGFSLYEYSNEFGEKKIKSFTK